MKPAKPAFTKIPTAVAPVRTKNRVINGQLPEPESLPLLEKIDRFQPRSLDCQPPIIWDRASGVHVFDPYGNQWIDFTSGVLVTNIGHNHPKVLEAVADEVQKGNLFSYCFPSSPSAHFAEKLAEILPPPLEKVFLLTTGAEATECAIKHARRRAQMIHPDKKIIITYNNGFHGRTLGAQLAGGSPPAKGWIGNLDPDFIQVPFPDGYRCERADFAYFLECLTEQGVSHDRIAAVMLETYQGGGAAFAPVEYIQALREFCTAHEALLIFDEVQSGFGRTGKFFAFEHYDVKPDLICMGKAISHSLPLSALAGSAEIMNLFNPGEMTSTHGGNPIACRAAIAGLEVMLEENLTQHAADMETHFQRHLEDIAASFPDQVGGYRGKGMVYAIDITKNKATKEPDAMLAYSIVEECFRRGLLCFAPVGFGGGSLKIAPPLVMDVETLEEAMAVLKEAFSAAVAAS